MPSSSETLATVSSDGWRSHTLPGLMGGLGLCSLAVRAMDGPMPST